MSTNSEDRFEHIIISGLPFARGRSYGEQTKFKILINLNYYKKPGILPDWDRVKHFINNHYLKAIEKYYPSGLMEMKGIAVGANVSLDDIIILNARYELLRWKRHLYLQNKYEQQSDECTGALCLPKATKSGDVLLGQNWDINQRILNDNIAVLLEVHPDPSEKMAPFFMLSEAGQLGRSGMNANGLGVIAMGLMCSEDHFESINDKTGYLPISLLRRMFIESPTYSVGLKRILSVPRHVSVNMIVATAEGEGLNIELTPNQYFISYPSIKKDIYTHSNHFKSEPFLSNNSIKEGTNGGSSLFRDRRLERQLIKDWKYLDEKSLINAFKDHLGFPDSLCMHIPHYGSEYTSNLPNDCTVANVIYNLTQKSMRLCKGQPCNALFVEYQL